MESFTKLFFVEQNIEVEMTEILYIKIKVGTLYQLLKKKKIKRDNYIFCKLNL